MTLDTQVRIKEWTDPVALHEWACRELLGAPGAVKEFTDRSIQNRLGQGLPAWLITTHNAGKPLEFAQAENEADQEWEAERFGPDGYVTMSFDTGYGYRDERGWRCSDLHAEYIVRIAAHLAQEGIEIAWCDEFTGEWHDGVDGLEEFARHGAAAQQWFQTTVLPAIAGNVNEEAH